MDFPASEEMAGCSNYQMEEIDDVRRKTVCPEGNFEDCQVEELSEEREGSPISSDGLSTDDQVELGYVSTESVATQGGVNAGKIISPAEVEDSIHLSEEEDEEDEIMWPGLPTNSAVGGESKFQLDSKAKPRICGTCEKVFTSAAGLREHTKIVHLKLKPHCCPLCNRMFGRKRELHSHWNTHTGLKLHVCETCGTKFGHRSSYNLHRQTQHTDIKPFVICPVCEKKFASKSSLQRHTLLHTGDRPFGCNECNKSYTQKRYLMRHKKLHTSNTGI